MVRKCAAKTTGKINGLRPQGDGPVHGGAASLIEQVDSLHDVLLISMGILYVHGVLLKDTQIHTLCLFTFVYVTLSSTLAFTLNLEIKLQLN